MFRIGLQRSDILAWDECRRVESLTYFSKHSPGERKNAPLQWGYPCFAGVKCPPLQWFIACLFLGVHKKNAVLLSRPAAPLAASALCFASTKWLQRHWNHQGIGEKRLQRLVIQPGRSLWESKDLTAHLTMQCGAAPWQGRIFFFPRSSALNVSEFLNCSHC